jgi:hypothetical protein
MVEGEQVYGIEGCDYECGALAVHFVHDELCHGLGVLAVDVAEGLVKHKESEWLA